MTKFTDFAALAAFIEDARSEGHDTSDQYASSFIEHDEMAKLTVIAEPEKTDMPDAFQVEAAVDLMMRTMFDVLRDTRMEDCAADLAWGFCNSFHMVAKRIEGREDDAAKKLGELARNYDPSEIYANELEDTQLLCQTLEGVRSALECMRDHAAEIYRVETGRPFSTVKGSRVSNKLNASMIDARDFLAGRAQRRRQEYAPEGPIVAFSGGQQWHDHEMLWNRLDQIKARIPNMILVTTAQNKGCDAIATAWAASRDVKVVQFKLDRSQGNRAAFVRNDRIVGLKPVEAIVCSGSGIQKNFAQKLHAAGVPLHVFRTADQRVASAA
ncbi:DUF2493 domain-containing protein [Qipengyuania citrea]|uniref:DUF2493 domain-containing protein n=1 Tax=Qipengyuania citrea TaxID=225971 RepID=UPI0032978374